MQVKTNAHCSTKACLFNEYMKVTGACVLMTPMRILCWDRNSYYIAGFQYTNTLFIALNLLIVFYVTLI